MLFSHLCIGTANSRQTLPLPVVMTTVPSPSPRLGFLSYLDNTCLSEYTFHTRHSHNYQSLQPHTTGTHNCEYNSMTHPSQADPEWITMRRQHQQECAAFTRQVNTEKLALLQRQEVERTEFNRRVETTQAELLARHSQQEGAYWTRRQQKQGKVCSPPAPPPPTQQQRHAPAAQMINPRPSATPASVPDRKLMPKPEPAKKPSVPRTFGEQKPSAQKVTATFAAQQPIKQAAQPAFQPRPVQQQTNKEAPGSSQPAQATQPKRDATASRANVTSRKDVEMVDLCNSDDDVLVELSKADYQKKTTPVVNAAPFCPAIPTATFQLFGNSSRKQMVSCKIHLRRCSLLTLAA